MTDFPDRDLWTAAFFNERFPAPVSPLGWSLVGSLVEQIALRDPLRYLGCRRFDGQAILKMHRGHPYVSVAVFQTLYKPFPRAFLPEDAARYFPEGDASLRLAAPYPKGLWDPRMLAALAVAFGRDPLNFLPWGNHRLWARFERRHAAEMEALAGRVSLLGESPDTETVLALLGQCRRADEDLLRLHRWSLTQADLWFSALRRVVGAGRGDVVSALTAGLPNRSLAVDAALGRLAEALAGNADGQSLAAAAAMGAFLSEHGHRSFSLDVWQPTFADEPEQVVRLAVADRGGSAGGSRQPPGREPASLPFLRRAVAAPLARMARTYIPLRENQRYAWQRSLALQRRLYLALGRRLAEEGSLRQAGDVFFLTREEAAAGSDLGMVATERRRQHEQWTAEWQASPGAHYPAFLRGDAPLAGAAAPAAGAAPCESGDVLRGRPVSAGVGRGPARVLTSAVDLGRVRRGDVLVTVSTDPAWTTVFGLLAGLVLERGGQLSHGAVVAREYGLPAVAGVAGAVTLLNDGDVITVDGGAGTVTRL